jgi:hypothetical protein
MTLELGLTFLALAALIGGMLLRIERRIVTLQRWAEMHAQPAPLLSQEEILKRRQFEPLAGISSEETEQDIRSEQRHRRRQSLAQYVMFLRAAERGATAAGAVESAMRFGTEADELVRGDHD